MPEQYVRVGEIDLWTEHFGDSSDPTIVLIQGGGSHAVLWPDALCQRLAAGHRSVIRFDNRDVGLSARVDFEQSPYTLADMACDVIGVLGAYDLAAAHVVGISMGGIIAQILAVEHGDRLRTLTSMSSTPVGRSYSEAIATGVRPPGMSLPAADPAVLQALADYLGTTPDRRAERAIQLRGMCSGTFAPFDQAFFEELERRCLERSETADRSANQLLAMLATPDYLDRLVEVGIPTLVIHGTEDRLVPFEHGQATVSAVRGARLLPIEGLGHEVIPESFAVLSEAILRHTDQRN
jgi:pimeloyl-ACP methyl ester carboxylesterase